MLEDERMIIIKELKITDFVVLSIDTDKTVCETLKLIYSEFSSEYQLYFANGGDQSNNSIPEVGICNELGIGLIEDLGDKIQSSSWLLKK